MKFNELSAEERRQAMRDAAGPAMMIAIKARGADADAGEGGGGGGATDTITGRIESLNGREREPRYVTVSVSHPDLKERPRESNGTSPEYSPSSSVCVEPAVAQKYKIGDRVKVTIEKIDAAGDGGEE